MLVCEASAIKVYYQCFLEKPNDMEDLLVVARLKTRQPALPERGFSNQKKNCKKNWFYAVVCATCS